MTAVALVNNPISGAGRAVQVAEALGSSLRDAGHDVRLIPSSMEPTVTWLDPALADRDVVLAVGGDGTVRMVAEGASRTDTPLYQVPMGTENLFARAMGMTAEHQSIIDAVEAGRVHRFDMAVANGEPCLLMASCGFDAAVVHDLASRRSGPISHWSYLPCLLRQLWRWRPIPVRISVDGSSLAGSGPGLCFVCNCREYGARFNPAPEASMDDGVLDVVFLPTRSRLGLLRWMLRARRGRHLEDERAVHVQGKSVQIETPGAIPWQVDGDRPSDAGSPLTMSVQVDLQPASLPVLLPAAAS